MKIFDKTEDSHFSPLKEIFSGRMIQQRWWGEDSRVALDQKLWRQTSSTRGYRNLCPDVTNVSVWFRIMSTSS
jgi:hypothetical protein